MQTASLSSSNWDQTHWKTSNWNSQHSSSPDDWCFFLRVRKGFWLPGEIPPANRRVCEQYTHKYSTYRVAQHDHISLREHALLMSCKAEDCASVCPLHNCHPRVMSQSFAAPDTSHQHKFSLTHFIHFSNLSDGLTFAHRPYESRPKNPLRCSTAEWRINTNPISHNFKKSKVRWRNSIGPEELLDRRIFMSMYRGRRTHGVALARRGGGQLVD